MPERPLRRVLAPVPASPERIFHHFIWFRGHNTARNAELFPRLARLDSYPITLPDSRGPRGAGLQLLRATQRPRDRLVFRAAPRSYRAMFTTDPAQIAFFPGPVVA